MSLHNNKTFDNYLIIHTDIDGLAYDINAIVKSCYPSNEVRVLQTDKNGQIIEQVHDLEILKLPVYMNIGLKESESDTAILVDVFFDVEDEESEKKYPLHFDFLVDERYGIKGTIKRRFYDLLCEVSGRTLPWGNLTGVRPTKIAMTMINEGCEDEQIIDYLNEAHRVSEQKINLSLDIAHKEKTLIDRIDCQNGYSLYIGIPFCPTTCLYCSFTSYPIVSWSKRLDEYLDALKKELDYVSNEFANINGSTERKNPDTIYIGGGTPTSLDEVHLEKLLKMITSSFDMKACKEFTCEAGRPDSITRQKLEIMYKYGVTRISVNPQTMQQKTLDLIGRRTTVDQVVDAFSMAREIGFDNINMDIILGLPGEGVEDVRDTLGKICKLGPDSLTVHSLAIKRASALKRRLDEIGIESLNNTDETMDLSSEAASKMNMKPYYLYRQKNMSGNFENTGFAKDGKEGLYNILIMEEVQTIVACGAGTVTKRVFNGDGPFGSIRIERCDNVKDVALYIEKIDEMIERKRQLFA